MLLGSDFRVVFHDISPSLRRVFGQRYVCLRKAVTLASLATAVTVVATRVIALASAKLKALRTLQLATVVRVVALSTATTVGLSMEVT